MQMEQKNLLSILRERADKDPERKLFGSEKWLSYQEVLALTEGTAAALRSKGFCDGDHAALVCKRDIRTSVMLLALRAAGVVVVLLDPKGDVNDALSSTEVPIPVKAVIEEDDVGNFRISYCESGRVETLHPGSMEAAPGTGTGALASQPAFIIFTSGSTGKKKAAVLTEGNLFGNLENSFPLGDYRDDDIALMSLPFHHVFGLVLLAGTVILGYAAYFPKETDVCSLLRAIEQERLTRMNGVPSLYLAMAENSSSYDISSMRAGFVGGSPVTPEQFAYIEETLGMTLVPVYGMSECIGISCASYRDPRESRMKGNGKFYACNTCRIVLEDGSDAAPGTVGEICANGPSRMYGYYGSPLAADEMIHTGDLGYTDADGILHLTGRKKDIIIRNGNNLSPRRIEEALLALPSVHSAVVVGIPDDREGEVPAAMLIADEKVLAPELPKNELPAVYCFVDSIPLTSSGKPDRVLISQMLEAYRKDSYKD